MPVAACSDTEFLSLFKAHGPHETARILGIHVRSVYMRRSKLEKVVDQPIAGPAHPNATRTYGKSYTARIPIEVKSGHVLVGSDAHYWPGLISTAHRGFCHLARELQPEAVILNGDAFDGARVGRHPPIGWQELPSVKQEMETCDERLHEIRKAAPKAKPFWFLGNHDLRFESRLAKETPEMEGLAGFQLSDRFPDWTMGISGWINDAVVVKHRFKGGIHATHNNTLWAGKSMVTGHLHSLKVTPFDDYNGTRWGVDTGTMSDPYGPQFFYGEDNPLNHRSGFIVLTFHQGKLLWPEIVHVVGEGRLEFRGKIVQV